MVGYTHPTCFFRKSSKALRFSYIPQGFHHYKVPVASALTLILIVLNIRGVKESITVMAPIFMIFVGTHLLMLVYGVFTHTDKCGPLACDIQAGFVRH